MRLINRFRQYDTHFVRCQAHESAKLYAVNRWEFIPLVESAAPISYLVVSATTFPANTIP